MSSPSRRARHPGALVVLLSLALVLSLLPPAHSVAATSPPDPPVIASPLPTQVGAEDVHMEIGAPFHDPDGDTHQATDWEIRADEGATVVWAAYNSSELVHAHFSDGTFQGPLAGQRQLRYRTDYLFRVRFQDSQGAWSAWSERAFRTASQVTMSARQVLGILARPAPRWRSEGDSPILLPGGARLFLESGHGTTLLTLESTGDGLTATPGALLAEADSLRLRVVAPAEAGIRLIESRLAVVALVAGQAERLTLYLPTLWLAPGGEQVLWASETGATFYGTADQTHSTRELLARDLPIPWRLEPGYHLEAATASFQMPVSLAFVPDPGTDPDAPRFYVTELYGRIKVVTNNGRVYNFAAGLLNVNPTGVFPGSGELGVIGVCLSPTSRDVYATMVYRDNAGSLRNKLVRIRSTDGLRAEGLDDILVVRGGQGLARPSHQIQQCSFGPDGKLYTFIADGPDPAAAQEDRSFGGKVVRLNPDGSAPTDNPRYDKANPTAPISYQYTKGQRNAYGSTWRPSDNRLYLTENGPNVDRLVRVIAGHNYGWDGTDDSMSQSALYVWPEAHWSPVGLAFVEGPGADLFPAAKQGRLLVATAGLVYARGPQRVGKAIQEFVLDANGAITTAPTIFARYVGEGRGSIVDLRLQPDGLYFTDLYLEDGQGGPTAPGGKVWRVRYTGQAAFTPSATSGPAPLVVSFADTSSFITPGVPQWDFGDGTTSEVTNPIHTFTAPGRYAVSLRRTAPDGVVSEHLALITVTDPATGGVPLDEAAARPLPAPPAAAAVFFPETGVVLGGGFKIFWEQRGGLAQFGYPITEELRERNPADGQVYTVQYFERARFEYHPEHQGTPYETQLGLLGRQATTRRLGEAPFQRVPSGTGGEGALFFEATGHALSGPFRQHWEATGGADIYGLPLSEPFIEGSLTDGRPYMVQYFERARMEHHPENAGRPEEIELARLGLALYVRAPAPRLAN